MRLELWALAAGGPAAVLVSGELWVCVGLVGTLAIVLAVELLNTAIEKLCDHVCPQHHPTIGLVKDMGSAAVMFALILAGLAWSAALVQAVARWPG